MTKIYIHLNLIFFVINNTLKYQNIWSKYLDLWRNQEFH